MSQPEPELRLYEKLLMIFPGYRGYKEKELIRETDKIVREGLYRKLRYVIDTLRGIQSDLVSHNRLAEAGEIERLIYYLDTLSSKTRHALHGYKPLFHVVKIDEKDLRALLEHDLSLGEIVDKMTEQANSLRRDMDTPSDVKEQVKLLFESARLYESKLNERDQILLGIGGVR